MVEQNFKIRESNVASENATNRRAQNQQSTDGIRPVAKYSNRRTGNIILIGITGSFYIALQRFGALEAPPPPPPKTAMRAFYLLVVGCSIEVTKLDREIFCDNRIYRTEKV